MFLNIARPPEKKLSSWFHVQGSNGSKLTAKKPEILNPKSEKGFSCFELRFCFSNFEP